MFAAFNTRKLGSLIFLTKLTLKQNTVLLCNTTEMVTYSIQCIPVKTKLRIINVLS